MRLLLFSVCAVLALAQRQALPTPTAALGSLTVRGAKLYYADGSVVNVAPPGNNVFNKWRNAPATGLQVVKVFFNQIYRTWHNGPDHANETTCDADTFYPDRDHRHAGHCAVLNYVHLFHGAKDPADVYWWDGAADWGAGLVTDVPVGLPANASKTGTLIPDADFIKIYNTAKDDHVAP